MFLDVHLQQFADRTSTICRSATMGASTCWEDALEGFSLVKVYKQWVHFHCLIDQLLTLLFPQACSLLLFHPLHLVSSSNTMYVVCLTTSFNAQQNLCTALYWVPSFPKHHPRLCIATTLCRVSPSSSICSHCIPSACTYYSLCTNKMILYCFFWNPNTVNYVSL